MKNLYLAMFVFVISLSTLNSASVAETSSSPIVSEPVQVKQPENEKPTATPSKKPAPTTTDSDGFNDKKTVIDLMYMTNKGDRTSVVGYLYSDGATGITSGATNSNFATITSKSSQLAFQSYYGLLENFYVSLVLGYLIDGKNQSVYGPAAGSANGQTVTLDYQGFEDPIVEFKWRPIIQGNAPVNLNVGISYSPKLSDSKGATASDNGDGARGGDLTDLILQTGNKFTKFAYSIEFDYRLYGQRTTKYSTGSSNTATGGNQFSGTLNFQYMPVDITAFRLSVGRIGKASTATTSSAGTLTTESDTTAYGVMAGAYYYVIPSSFALGLEYSRVTIGAHDLSSGSTGFKVADNTTNNYGLKLMGSF